METIEKVLIVIVQLDSNDIYMKRDDIGKRYFAFYGEEIDAAISDKCLFLLIQDKLVTEKGDDIVPTAAGIQQGLEAHVRYYFTKGIKASVKSNADRQYKENKNRGVVKSDSIIDEEQLEFILTELRHCRRAIVDLGCGTGDLAACIQRKLGSKVKGLDNSHEMISIARDSHPNMNWEVGDIENYDDDTEASAFLLIDSIYFVKEKKEVLRNLYSKLECGGKIVLTYSSYTQAKNGNDHLAAEKSSIGEILKSLSLAYEYKEFTRNEILLWESRQSLLEALRIQYTNEHNEYLYYDKKNEGDSRLRLLRKGMGKRYIYVIRKTCT